MNILRIKEMNFLIKMKYQEVELIEAAKICKKDRCTISKYIKNGIYIDGNKWIKN